MVLTGQYIGLTNGDISIRGRKYPGHFDEHAIRNFINKDVAGIRNPMDSAGIGVYKGSIINYSVFLPIPVIECAMLPLENPAETTDYCNNGDSCSAVTAFKRRFPSKLLNENLM